MELTLVGTGSPVPIPERGGTSIVVDVADERVLIDCGPKTVYGLMDAGIRFGEIETMFFTHHHLDHNASFFHFAFTSWTEGGRESLTVYGPDGTDRLLDALYDVYAEDIEYRQDIYPTDGISNIETELVTEGSDRGWTAGRSRRFRSNTPSRRTPTGSPSTTPGRRSSSPATCGRSRRSPSSPPTRTSSCRTATLPPSTKIACPMRTSSSSGSNAEGERDLDQSTLTGNHCDATDAGELAQDAGVETLVLTHIMPYRDLESMRRDAEAAFDGDVIIAEDGLTLTP